MLHAIQGVGALRAAAASEPGILDRPIFDPHALPSILEERKQFEVKPQNIFLPQGGDVTIIGQDGGSLLGGINTGIESALKLAESLGEENTPLGIVSGPLSRLVKEDLFPRLSEAGFEFANLAGLDEFSISEVVDVFRAGPIGNFFGADPFIQGIGTEVPGPGGTLFEAGSFAGEAGGGGFNFSTLGQVGALAGGIFGAIEGPNIPSRVLSGGTALAAGANLLATLGVAGLSNPFTAPLAIAALIASFFGGGGGRVKKPAFQLGLNLPTGVNPTVESVLKAINAQPFGLIGEAGVGKSFAGTPGGLVFSTSGTPKALPTAQGQEEQLRQTVGAAFAPFVNRLSELSPEEQEKVLATPVDLSQFFSGGVLTPQVAPFGERGFFPQGFGELSTGKSFGLGSARDPSGFTKGIEHLQAQLSLAFG